MTFPSKEIILNIMFTIINKRKTIVMKSFAFTLAEVLVTLGIIGVVAAMTIPTLMANVKSQQYRSTLNKTISTLNQAAKMSLANYDFDYSGISQACLSNGGSDNPEDVQTICALLNGTLTGVTYYETVTDIKVNKNGSQNYSVTGSLVLSPSYSTFSYYHAYVLADGTIVGIEKDMGQDGKGCSLEFGKSLTTYGDTRVINCLGFIDVNGTSPPNKEVSCSSGSNALEYNTCVVKNNPKYLTDVYPIRFHDQIVEPATAAGRYVLKNPK